MTPTEAAIHRSKTVSVMVNGSPSSTLALLWTLQHGCASPQVVVLDELDPLSRSYVEGLASLFGLSRPVALVEPSHEPQAIVWGARLGKAVEKREGGVTHVRPLIGYSEQEISSQLRALGIRVHPAFALGIGPATIEFLREEADQMQIETMDQALAVMAIKRGHVEIDEMLIEPPKGALEEEPAA